MAFLKVIKAIRHRYKVHGTCLHFLLSSVRLAWCSGMRKWARVLKAERNLTKTISKSQNSPSSWKSQHDDEKQFCPKLFYDGSTTVLRHTSATTWPVTLSHLVITPCHLMHKISEYDDVIFWRLEIANQSICQYILSWEPMLRHYPHLWAVTLSPPPFAMYMAYGFGSRVLARR